MSEVLGHVDWYGHLILGARFHSGQRHSYFRFDCVNQLRNIYCLVHIRTRGDSLVSYELGRVVPELEESYLVSTQLPDHLHGTVYECGGAVRSDIWSFRYLRERWERY